MLSGQRQRQPLRPALREAQRVLAAAGVASPRVDAELLAAHVLGVPRTRLALVDLVDQHDIDTLRALVDRRATRVPLQHLTGTAVLGAVEVGVGPGVFVPRPETELLLVWGLAAISGRSRPRVVDLCTGSGALALAVSAARPDAEVHAVDIDPEALRWARQNVRRRRAPVRLHHDDPVRLHHGDVADPDLLAELTAATDLVLCNPPYVPVSTAFQLPPEVTVHDPPHAVFAGADGLEVIRHVVRTAARLLRPGGFVAIEHHESHGSVVAALLRSAAVHRCADQRAAVDEPFDEITEHVDLAGQPRFSTARRA